MQQAKTAATHCAQTKIDPTPTKYEKRAMELLEVGTDGLSKHTSRERDGEFHLSTTISELGLDYGFTIAREKRPYIRQSGKPTRTTWYWLPDQQEAIKAIKFVNAMRSKRRYPPLTDEQVGRLLSKFPENSIRDTA